MSGWDEWLSPSCFVGRCPQIYKCQSFLPKPSAVKLEAENNKKTEVRTRWLCDTTAAYLMPYEIKMVSGGPALSAGHMSAT